MKIFHFSAYRLSLCEWDVSFLLFEKKIGKKPKINQIIEHHADEMIETNSFDFYTTKLPSSIAVSHYTGERLRDVHRECRSQSGRLIKEKM